MNPFNLEESIVVEGISIKLPTVVGDSNIISSTTFKKPSWLPDSEASLCLNCKQTFTHFRRKHHCRHCGKIFCSKCCTEKISLPHFGMEEPERVCNDCKLIVELMTKLKASDPLLQYEGAHSLSDLVTSATGLSKVIECGCLHMMMSLAKNDCDTKLKDTIAHTLHSVAQNMVLNPFLVEIGCLKALKDFMIPGSSFSHHITDSIRILNLFCMNTEIKMKVLKEGMIDDLLTVINMNTGVTSVLAAQVLQSLVCNFEHYDFISQNHGRIVNSLFYALEIEDYEMQGKVSRMLMYFSAGSNCFRQQIIQEDESRNFPLLFLLKGSSEAIILNVTCTIANLSLSVDQNSAHHYISGMCELLSWVKPENGELLSQLARGLANYAENPSNVLHMLNHLPVIISSLLKSTFEVPKFHACRLIVYFFSSELSCSLSILSQSGLEEFIETAFRLPGFSDTLNNLFLRKVSRLSVCQQ